MKRILLSIVGFIALGLLVLFAKKQTSANANADPGDEDQSADYPDMLPVHTKFPDFHVKSIDGKPLSIATDKGKVILLDFWATWCGPCCAELPNVVEVYNKYHKDGFDIIGVSLDGPDYKSTLASFLPGNGVTWPQFCDGQAWDNALAVQYKIHAIPCTYLLDGSGTIIGENLRGSSLAGAVARALIQAANHTSDTSAPASDPAKAATPVETAAPVTPAAPSHGNAPTPSAAPAKTDAAAPAPPRRLKPNLTHDDIINALGAPDSDAKLGNHEVLNYKNGPHVELNNGTVTTFTGAIPDALKQPDGTP